MKKHEVIYTALVDRIRSGKYLPHEKLPTENELAEEFSFSRQTVRQALISLQQNEYIYTIQGSGSFVSDYSATKIKHKRIAVITTYISTYIFPHILRGIENVVSEHGYTMLLGATNNAIAREYDILESLGSEHIDGIIVEGTKTALPNNNVKYYQRINENGIPIVFFNGYYPDLLRDTSKNIKYIVTDDYGGGYKHTNELIKAGHTSICGIFKSDDMQGIQRFAGFADAFYENNIKYNDNNVIWYNTQTKSSIMHNLENMGVLDNCTAFVCYNDEIAAELISSGWITSKTPPVSVRSFDRTLNGQAPETLDFYSLDHPKEKLGEAAARCLFQMIDGYDVNNTVLPWVD